MIWIFVRILCTILGHDAAKAWNEETGKWDKRVCEWCRKPLRS